MSPRRHQESRAQHWFTSPRERRLWMWTGVVLVTIYSTLGLARPVAGALRESGLLTPFFVAAMVLAGVAVLTQGLQVRPRGAEIAVGLGVAAVYLLLFVRMAIPEERSHLLEYSVVGAFVYEALAERARHRRIAAVPLLALLLSAAAGALDEGIQAIVPSRIFDPIDIAFNTLASTMAILGCVALGWARRRVTRRTAT